MKSEYVVRSISDNCLKLSTMDSLNDPYEMLPTFINPDGSRAPIGVIREDMRRMLRNTGIFCMSTAINSSAMWAHYADRHKGVAWELEFTEDQMRGLDYINYTDSRVEMPSPDELKDAGVRNEFFKQLVKTKARCWEWEKEVRWVFNVPNDPGIFTDEKGLKFRGLPKELRRIILGVDCELRPEEIGEALHKMTFTDVVVIRAQMCDETFNINIDPPNLGN